MLLIGLRDGRGIRDVDEASCKPDYPAVPPHRNLGGDNLPDLASDKALPGRAGDGIAVPDDALLVFPELLRMRGPSHVLVGLPEYVALADAVVAVEGFACAEEPPVPVLPEEADPVLRGYGVPEILRRYHLLLCAACLDPGEAYPVPEGKVQKRVAPACRVP